MDQIKVSQTIPLRGKSRLTDEHEIQLKDCEGKKKECHNIKECDNILYKEQ